MNAPSSKRQIPTLDGLRALSILCVVAAHAAVLPRGTPYLAKVAHAITAARVLSQTGVHVFFVISGYLITTLLLRERATFGRIDLRRFYFRRTLRIFPPFYAYLGVIGILVATGLLDAGPIRWWPAVAYMSNLVPTGSWLVGHSWTLSVEEQFYLVWPALVLVSTLRGATRLALSVLALSPLVRLGFLTAAEFPGFNGLQPAADTWSFDFLAAGSALALMGSSLRESRVWQYLMRSPWIWAAPIAMVGVRGLWPAGYGWLLADLAIVRPLEVASLAWMVAWCLANAQSPFGRFLDLAPMRSLGVLSYSLYLWQQVFLRADSSLSLLAALCGALAAAAASYFLVERPALRFREWLEPRVFTARARPVRADFSGSGPAGSPVTGTPGLSGGMLTAAREERRNTPR